MSQHKYKLTYAKGRGLAEISRLLFAEAGVEYEDERWTPDEFQEKKKDQPFKTIPVLEVDGKKYCQGSAISRFLAREFGLMGTNNLEAFKIDEIQECMTDLRMELRKYRLEQDDTKKEEAMNQAFTVFLPKLFDYLTMRLKENNGGNGFFVGDTVSYADLAVYRGFEMCQDVYKRDVLEMSNDLLRAHFKRVATQPRIAEWLEKRPVTEF